MCSCAKNKDLFRSFIRSAELAIKCHARSQRAEAGRLPGAHHHATLLWLTPENIAVYAQGRGVNATRLFSECRAPRWWAHWVCKWQGPPFSLVSAEASLGAKSKVGIKPFLHFGNFGIRSWSEDGISLQSNTLKVCTCSWWTDVWLLCLWLFSTWKLGPYTCLLR